LNSLINEIKRILVYRGWGNKYRAEIRVLKCEKAVLEAELDYVRRYDRDRMRLDDMY